MRRQLVLDHRTYLALITLLGIILAGCGNTVITVRQPRHEEDNVMVAMRISDQPFAGSVERLGGPAVFGIPLSKPRLASDGRLEQVYANAVFYAPRDHPEQVRLRPLPGLLGYPKQVLATEVYSDRYVFYEIEDGLGHNVSAAVDQFIALHGGRDLSGQPVTEEFRQPDDKQYRQCFENYCVLYNPDAPEKEQVRLAPLGVEYLK